MRRYSLFDNPMSLETLGLRLSPSTLAPAVTSADSVGDEPLPDPEPAPGPDPGTDGPVSPPPLPPSGPIGPGNS